MKLESASAELQAFEQMPGIADDGLRVAMKAISDEHEALGNSLLLEQQRLIARYGPDSEQAKTAAVRLDLHDLMEKGIKVYSERFNIRTPDPSANQFVVYGRVINDQGDGLGGLKVSAIDKNAREIAHAKTDDGGVFELSVGADIKPAPRESGAIEIEESSEVADIKPELRLQIEDRRKKNLYRDEETFEPAADRLLYREIVLSQKPGTKDEDYDKKLA